MILRLLFSSLLVLGVSACLQDPALEKPAPEPLTREAEGHYCGMIIADHPGPKAQLFVAGRDKAVWFSSVRDAIAFTMLPEETDDIAVFYVTDMTGFQNWQIPPAQWIEIQQAYFVIGSRMRGGMGAMETVPFATNVAAQDFASEYGGMVVRFDDVPTEYVLNSDLPEDFQPRGEPAKWEGGVE